MGFFGSLFGGSSSELNQDINNAGNTMNFGSALGQKDLSKGSDFWNTILSGNPDAIAKLLGPQISTIQKQGQQQLNTAEQFGNRSGGTNAAGQTNMDTQRSEVEDMIAKLTGEAAGQVTDIGKFGVDTGLKANEIQASEAEQKMKNIMDSLFGQMISSGAGALESFGLGKMGI